MQTVTTIGLDIAKSVFQVHGIGAQGNVMIRRQLKRRYVLAFFEKLPQCLVGIEACVSSHHWSRELQALGHTVRLMPPADVKPYVKRHKNDVADALRGTHKPKKTSFLYPGNVKIKLAISTTSRPAASVAYGQMPALRSPSSLSFKPSSANALGGNLPPSRT